jgi:hypothetical protein
MGMTINYWRGTVGGGRGEREEYMIEVHCVHDDKAK